MQVPEWSLHPLHNLYIPWVGTGITARKPARVKETARQKRKRGRMHGRERGDDVSTVRHVGTLFYFVESDSNAGPRTHTAPLAFECVCVCVCVYV
jgi:hypothetical protein